MGKCMSNEKGAMSMSTDEEWLWQMNTPPASYVSEAAEKVSCSVIKNESPEEK